jgi:hypothetical protein
VLGFWSLVALFCSSVTSALAALKLNACLSSSLNTRDEDPWLGEFLIPAGLHQRAT